MTLGIGRGMDLNFTTLATLLEAGRQGKGFVVRSLVQSTGFHENKVKGHQSWARAMGLVDGTVLTPLAHQLLQHDSAFVHPLSRGVCYVEIASNPNAEAAYYIANEVLPRADHSGTSVSTDQVVAMLSADGVGESSSAAGQPRRDADLFLRSLRSPHAFGPLGVLSPIGRTQYIATSIQLGAELTGYAMLRRWPRGRPYLRLTEAHRLVAPLLLAPDRFSANVAALERIGIIVRITSSGLDQVRPASDRQPEDALWGGE